MTQVPVIREGGMGVNPDIKTVLKNNVCRGSREQVDDFSLTSFFEDYRVHRSKVRHGAGLIHRGWVSSISLPVFIGLDFSE